MWFYVLALVQAASAVPLPSNCGTPAITPAKYGEKIVGGKEAIVGSWPWQVQIRFRDGHWCGGTLISNDWVLTAAHCFEMPNTFYSLRVGRHTEDGRNEPHEQTASIKRLYMHERYNGNTMQNDIALVRLDKSLTFNNRVHPACLASSQIATGTNAYVTGWGDTMGTCCKGLLKQATVPIIATSTCQQWDWYGNQLYAGMMCAGYQQGGVDSCQGDSGGPLVAQVNGKWEVHGVVSWGRDCAKPKKPGVYSSVTYFKTWITSKIVMAEAEEAAMKFRPAAASGALREMMERLEEENLNEREE